MNADVLLLRGEGAFAEFAVLLLESVSLRNQKGVTVGGVSQTRDSREIGLKELQVVCKARQQCWIVYFCSFVVCEYYSCKMRGSLTIAYSADVLALVCVKYTEMLHTRPLSPEFASIPDLQRFNCATHPSDSLTFPCTVINYVSE